MVIVKVRANKAGTQKVITVPFDCDIKKGDFVRLIKVEEKE